MRLNPQTKKWTYFTIPYPLGFYARGMDGRIDDANAGWKGRALYSNYGTHFVWQVEGGKGTKGKLVKFQLVRIRWPDNANQKAKGRSSVSGWPAKERGGQAALSTPTLARSQDLREGTE